MNSIKYTMNAFVVGLFLYAIYGFLGSVSVLIYPRLGMLDYELKSSTQVGEGFLYSKIEFCLKKANSIERETCFKNLDKKYNVKYVEGLLNSSRFSAIRNLVKNCLLLIVVFTYFVFFRRLISIGECNKSDDYGGSRKPSCKRVIRR